MFKAEKLPGQLQDRRTNKDIMVQYKNQNSCEKNISE